MHIKILRQSCIYTVLVVATSVAILAQQGTQPTASPERLRTHITYLASDALEGRRTGTAGANGAAQYIAAEFLRLGLRPAMPNGHAAKNRNETLSKYLQKFPYVSGVELGKGNELSFKLNSDAATKLRVRDDWMPLGLSANGRIENIPAAFVGYGITVAELKYDDYANANAAGKIAIAFSGTPDGDNPHGQFARYEDVRWKAIAARNAGAKALVVVAREEDFNQDRSSRLKYDNTAGDAGLPVIGISRQTATRLFQLSTPAQLNELEKKVQSSSAGSKTERIQGYDITTTVQHDFFKGLELSLATDVTRTETAAANVIGILEGSDPILKSEAIVIGAHYDHLGRGGAGSLAHREGEVHHGADDNASGTAGLMELARIFSAQRGNLRTIVFAAFSGEEEGLLGSNYYVNQPAFPIADTIAMINMDMIGRMKGNKLIIGGVGTSKEWRQIINNANAAQKMTVTASGEPATQASSTEKTDGRGTSPIPIVVSANGRPIVSMTSVKPFDLTLNEDGFGPSDHSSFNAKRVPVLFMWTGTHEDYHKPSDTADKINYEDEVRVLDVVSRIVRDLDRSDKRPAYTVGKTESTGRAMGFRVYLGTIPNYSDSNDGLLLDGVREDSPAAKAGLSAGDRIVKMAGREVRNVYDYTYALGEMKAGQEYEVEIVRGTERLKLKLIPAARK